MYEGRLKKNEWTVRTVGRGVAMDLVREHHYARGASKQSVYLHGLFPVGEFWDVACQGVAWWIPPTRDAGQATYPQDCQGVLSLSRLVVTPETPKNACTFMLARSMRMIDRKRWPCLVTYADEWQGHEGTIYRAANWDYVGLTKPERIYTKGGRMISRKRGDLTRTHAEMIAFGAVLVGSSRKHKFVHIKG